MDLKEQLKKVLSDQKKLERKKDDFMEEYEGKKKKILLKKKELEQKIQKEKNEKILQAVKESFGEINEKYVIEDQPDLFLGADLMEA